MKYCSSCGANIRIEVPAGDNRPRHVCNSCEEIHYSNPKIIAGCLPVFEDKVLLCKRAIEPRIGYWTLPAGFMENNESTEQAASRETLEEANARVSDLQLYSLTSMTHISHVQMIYLAQLDDLNFFPGEESLEVELFTEADLPWEDIAFQSITNALRCYFEDRHNQQFPLRHFEINTPSKRPLNKASA